MERERFEIAKEYEKQVAFYHPVNESFDSVDKARRVWGEDVAEDPEFKAQIENRRELNNSLSRIDFFKSLGHDNVFVLLQKGLIDEDELFSMYESLSSQLDSNMGYDRMLLYLPFEFFGDESVDVSDRLSSSLDRFKDVYKASLKKLLHFHDVRSNFVNGDESDDYAVTGEHHRVVKAAHLFPKLLEHGVIDFDFILQLLKDSQDEMFFASFADGIKSMIDMNLLNADQISILKSLNIDIINQKIDNFLLVKSEGIVEDGFSIENAQTSFAKDMEDLKSKDYSHYTLESRAKWLKLDDADKLINSYAEKLYGLYFNNKETAFDDILNDIAENDSVEYKKVLIEVFKTRIENLFLQDKDKLKSEFKDASTVLSVLLKIDGLQSEVNQLSYYLYAVGVVDQSQLLELGLKPANLNPEAGDIIPSINNEMLSVKSMINKMESDPLLSQYVYPTALLYGSKVKGYGNPDSDTDVAVFIKPGTDPSLSGSIKESLGKVFNPQILKGDVVQFWLKEENGKLEVIDMDNQHGVVGHKSWTHVLFGAIWEGDANITKELRQKLLTPYLYESNEVVYDRDSRGLYLEEMERDLLQFRLMHKGYQKFYPKLERNKIYNNDDIDGKSMFWDPGYRLVATKIYAKKVFLPKLKANKNI